MENNITFHINNMAYTIKVDDRIREDITKNLSTDKNLDTKEVLAAYLRVTQELYNFKQDLEAISDKIPKL
ncbi:MAG: hypothetical protein C0625_04970 [Arcobacter sp.]|nr:MAG: hypothetical protein C0625_04970 [Arcobacter sp.]